MSSDGLIWHEDGYGYYPACPNGTYGEEYFGKYQRYARTELGRTLTDLRIAMVARHIGDGGLIDWGSGANQFVRARRHTWGYDINPSTVADLCADGLYVPSPMAERMPNASFWDSLEHVSDPVPVLTHRVWVFVSLPICEDAQHARTYRHFRPDEHYWHFTRDGLERYMRALGFELREHNDCETRAGRSDIESFAFRRRRG